MKFYNLFGIRVSLWIQIIPFTILFINCTTYSSINIIQLRCEYLENPSGIDVPNPRLSWVLESTERGQEQKAYQIIVSSTEEKLLQDEGDLWNSKKIKTTQSNQVIYNGKLLNSRTQCFWKVRIWDKKGKGSKWSEPAKWSMGLLNKSDWKAKWIGVSSKSLKNFRTSDERETTKIEQRGNPVIPPSPLLRKSFFIEKEIKQATVYVTALGLYELSLNGEKVGDQVLSPEWTDYNTRIQYQTFDVTHLLNKGENTLGAILADGWYIGTFGQWGISKPIRGSNYGSLDRKFLLQLEVITDDNQMIQIITDESWQVYFDGPIRSADMFLGEVYDARKTHEGWDLSGFDASGWEKVVTFPSTNASLVAQMNEPIRVVKKLQPVSISEPEPGIYVFDLGQNMVGWCRLIVNESQVVRLKLRHGEMLTPDGRVYMENLRKATQAAIFITNAKGENIFEPRFTYHGFQYVEITGLSKKPDVNMLTGMVVASDTKLTGKFECSNSELNQLWQNILWTQRGNMHSIPTDCPQRDERMGWMGDALVFAQTGIFNMDMAAFFTKWCRDVRDAQDEDGRYADFSPLPNKNMPFFNAPGWADAGIIVPWRVYQNYSDTGILKEQYQSAKQFIDFIHTQNPDLVWINDVGNNYGDWLNGNTIVSDDYPSQGAKIPNDVFATAYFAYSTEILSKMAVILGYEPDADKYSKLAKSIREVFNEKFVNSDGRLKGDCQAGYAMALSFNLLPEELQKSAAEHMAREVNDYDLRISTGFHSTILLMKELSNWEYCDLAYQLLESHRFPSWLYSIDQGATTIWERWDGYVEGRGFQDAGMNSFNHYSFGSVAEFMYRTILGINPDDNFPGYKKFIIHPQPGGTLKWAKGEYQSIHGKIVSEWKLENKRFILKIKIPANTNARVIIPAKNIENITESNRPVKKAKGVELISFKNGTAIFEVLSGEYTFTSEY